MGWGAVVVVVSMLRVWNLGSPAQRVFDEGWYAFGAVAYLGGGAVTAAPPVVAIDGDSTPQHPLLGKWLITAGVGPSNRPVGWRLPSVVFGVAGVLLVYLLALVPLVPPSRMWRRPSTGSRRGR